MAPALSRRAFLGSAALLSAAPTHRLTVDRRTIEVNGRLGQSH